MTGGLRLVEAQKVFNREARRGFRLQRFLTLPAVDIPTMLLIKQVYKLTARDDEVTEIHLAALVLRIDKYVRTLNIPLKQLERPWTSFLTRAGLIRL